MSKSILSILDNSCTNSSPCLKCPRHLDGLDKNQCIPSCRRLSAYRDGLEYNHLPWPELKDLQDVETEDKISPKNEKHKAKLSHTLQKKGKTGDSMPKTKKMPVKRNEKVCVDLPVPKPQKPKKPRKQPSFRLYLTRYPQIKKYLTETCEEQGLPLQHVAVALLSEAIIARKRKDKS